MSDQLLRKIRRTDPVTLEDLVLIMAKNIVKSLKEGGAKGGVDYTIRDLYNWAMPFALEIFKDNDKKISYAIEF